MIPVERWSVRSTATPVASASSSAISALVGVARGAGRGVGGAARRDDGLGPAEAAARIARRGREVRLREADGRRRERVRGEDGGRGGRTRRGDGHGEVRPTGGLDPGCQPAGSKAERDGASSLDRREDGRRPRDRGSRATVIGVRGLRGQRQLEEARGLRQPVDEVEGLDRLAGGALDEVVLHADRDDPAGPLVEADVDADLVAAGDVLGRRRVPRRRSRTARRRRPSRRAHRARPG